ncbi:MAG: phenylalanine--tRNA ligase subunit beta [Clostridia bacterium]|nr:phenylalanine--tRNA ligase subunit beta [Clostridia bacterium]
MKVSLNWLKDYASFPADLHEYTEGMTMSGTKVEGWEALGEDIENIVAGKVLAMERHPDSDHLWVCSVDAGGERPLQIVTGAQNVREGDLVPVCLDGAKLPGGKTIKTGKLRGVLSEGMLCSISELGLTLHDFPYAIEDGIFILKEDCKPGDDIRDVLMLRDTLVDFELTFNRPDCLALLGIARETAATFRTALKYEEPHVAPKNDGDDVNRYVSVKVENSVLCPRYTARAVKNVKIGPSPLWMRARLRACGVRPINNIVDITNYVMLEYGQPMHAFDHEFIKSKSIVVRNAREGESIITLDSAERKLDPSMLVIADGERAIALAGVMGGENSEINENTKTVIFESANFNRENIRFTSRAVGLRTDSSKRFEKGLPPYNALPAINRACRLVEELGCGEVVDGVIDVCSADIAPYKVDFKPQRINQILGTSLCDAEIADILSLIEFKVEGDKVTVPAYRTDIVNTADLAEEVGRLYGVDKIEGTRFEGRAAEGHITPGKQLCNLLDEYCTGLGYSEIYTYSFISPLWFDKIRLSADDARRDAIKIRNPLGDETSIMRTTALPSMLSCIALNYSRHNLAAKLFETATVFRKSGEMSDERKILCLGSYGSGDFFDIKGDIEAILDGLGIKERAFVRCTDEHSYHPGRCAEVFCGETRIGVFGQVHPLAAREFGIECECFAAELELDALSVCRAEPQYAPIPVFPASERDLALVMDEDAEAGNVCGIIKKYGGKALVSVNVFDVYRGKGVEEGKKSVAFRLTFRLPDKTLSDEEVDKAISKILKKLEEEAGIALRS